MFSSRLGALPAPACRTWCRAVPLLAAEALLNRLTQPQALDAGQLQAMMMGAHHPHNQQHAPHPDDAGDDDAGDAASVASSSSGSDAEGLGAAGEPAGADDEAGGGAGGEWAAGDDWEGPQDEAGLVSRAKAAGIMGRLEPGVLALAVDGPLITTVNTLGGRAPLAQGARGGWEHGACSGFCGVWPAMGALLPCLCCGLLRGTHLSAPLSNAPIPPSRRHPGDGLRPRVARPEVVAARQRLPRAARQRWRRRGRAVRWQR